MDTFKLVLLGGGAAAALTLARPSVAETPAPTGPSFTATPAGPPKAPKSGKRDPIIPRTPAVPSFARPSSNAGIVPASAVWKFVTVPLTRLANVIAAFVFRLPTPLLKPSIFLPHQTRA